MNTLFYYFEKWQSQYCAGSKIPRWFREEFTSLIDLNYEGALKDFKYKNKNIFRIINLDENKLIFNDLYYSFSSNLKGIQEVIKYDTNLKKSYLFLLICKPLYAINFNKLGEALYEHYKEIKYAKENEIISKLNFDNLLEIYLLKN